MHKRDDEIIDQVLHANGKSSSQAGKMFFSGLISILRGVSRTGKNDAVNDIKKFITETNFPIGMMIHHQPPSF